MTTINQINEFINRGLAVLVLAVVGLMLLYYFFGRDLEKAPQKSPLDKP